MKDLKVDLTLIKKLVSSLEEEISVAKSMNHSSVEDNNEYIVQLSKAIGILFGISQEASLLIGDIKNNVVASSSGTPDMKDLFSILAPTKGPNYGN